MSAGKPASFLWRATSNLDGATGESVMMLLRETQQSRGMAIVMVAYERQLTERLAGSCITAVRDGKLNSDGAKS
jgi:predicted ABC-type transport system involved in lysophospholipase L1 biosynthesis ATPase subunit